MKLKLYETKKLHYGEYLYKLVVPNQVAPHFRTEHQTDGKLGYVRERLDTLNRHFEPSQPVIVIPTNYESKFFSVRSRLHTDETLVEHYYDAIEIYRHLKNAPKEYKLRTENFILHIYSNNRDFIINLSNKLRHKHKEFWEPDPEKANLLEKDIIIKDKPVKFQYKITLGKKKGSPALPKWIDNNPSISKMGETAKQYCNMSTFVKGYYFYVKDDKALFLVQMIVGDNIQRIEKLVYSPKS